MTEITAGKKFAKLARLGYVARGVVYLTVGGLALLAALGKGGETTDSKGALLEIMSQPFGDLILVIIIVGLFGYAAWRLVQAIKDTDDHGRSGKGLAVRAGLLVSAVTHTLLALWAIGMLTGIGGGANDGSRQLMASEWGQWLLLAVGIAVIGAGLAHIYKGWTARFERYMKVPRQKQAWTTPICRFGLLARGVVWCIVGVFLIESAWQAHGGEVRGMAAALEALRATSFGPWLLGVVAAGLFAFGLYSLLEAVYRRVDVSFSDT